MFLKSVWNVDDSKEKTALLENTIKERDAEILLLKKDMKKTEREKNIARSLMEKL